MSAYLSVCVSVVSGCSLHLHPLTPPPPPLRSHYGQRATVIVHDPEAGTSTSRLAPVAGSFSKASFVPSAASAADDVALDDPDFWSKVCVVCCT